MRRIALGVGMLAVVLASGCKSTDVNPTKYAAIETDPKGSPPVAPPGPGDVSRKFSADRGRVAKAVFRHLSPGVTDSGDFVIDHDRGRWFFQKDSSVEGRIRSLRGRGPGDHWLTVEIRPEGADCVAIVRGTPKVDEAVALALLDQVEADLKPTTAEPPVIR